MAPICVPKKVYAKSARGEKTWHEKTRHEKKGACGFIEAPYNKIKKGATLPFKIPRAESKITLSKVKHNCDDQTCRKAIKDDCRVCTTAKSTATGWLSRPHTRTSAGRREEDVGPSLISTERFSSEQMVANSCRSSLWRV